MKWFTIYFRPEWREKVLKEQGEMGRFHKDPPFKVVVACSVITSFGGFWLEGGCQDILWQCCTHGTANLHHSDESKLTGEHLIHWQMQLQSDLMDVSIIMSSRMEARMCVDYSLSLSQNYSCFSMPHESLHFLCLHFMTFRCKKAPSIETRWPRWGAWTWNSLGRLWTPCWTDWGRYRTSYPQ